MDRSRYTLTTRQPNEHNPMNESRENIRNASTNCPWPHFHGALATGCVLILAVVYLAFQQQPQYTTTCNDNDCKMRHLIMVIRHSIRAPTRIGRYTFVKPQDYPTGLGQLTVLGREAAFSTGKHFVATYKHFLTGNPREVFARSSSIQRCYETAAIILAAMYPPRGMFAWKHSLDWQPIPIIFPPRQNDLYIQSCNVQDTQDLQYLYNDVGPSGFCNYKEFLHYLSEHIDRNYSAESGQIFENVIDILIVHRWNKKPMPDWAMEKYQAIKEANDRLSYESVVDYMPFYGHFLMRGVADRLQVALSEYREGNKPKSRLSLFNFHDTSVQAIIKGLNINPIGRYPDFIGGLFFEVTESSSGLVVQIKFSSGLTIDTFEYKTPEPLRIPACGFKYFCSVEKMIKILNDAYPISSVKHAPCFINSEKCLV